TIESTKPGAKSDDIFRAASTSIEKSLGQKLIHSIGHGIGINVHDFPQGMNDKSSFELKENMCLTVEPGFYRGFGIRIEDVLIVKKKAHLLTDAPKELEKI
ncbi:aminopeptidase P family protein, partial [Candidatus Woesearchaeota archaeon]|nr:aminopeptidase P family protein [Candidatus Woesearchaeota archaeon]